MDKNKFLKADAYWEEKYLNIVPEKVHVYTIYDNKLEHKGKQS